jgi:hypothetical protein
LAPTSQNDVGATPAADGHKVYLTAVEDAFGCDLDYAMLKTLRMTPAMAAGVSARLWTIEDIVNLMPAPVAKRRGPYSKRSRQ